jgi:hypothetical protein
MRVVFGIFLGLTILLGSFSIGNAAGQRIALLLYQSQNRIMTATMGGLDALATPILIFLLALLFSRHRWLS